MIYINQIGTCELGRGETFVEAFLNANKCGFNLTIGDIKEFSGQLVNGQVVWTSEPMEGYND